MPLPSIYMQSTSYHSNKSQCSVVNLHMYHTNESTILSALTAMRPFCWSGVIENFLCRT